MSGVVTALRCPHCRGPLVRDHNSESCDACRRLWPIGYLEGASMNAEDAQQLLDDAHAADAWDETCDALSWALGEIRTVQEQAERAIVAKQHVADIQGGKAIRAERTIAAVEALRDEWASVGINDPAAAHAADRLRVALATEARR